MEISSQIEEYLKAIYNFEEENKGPMKTTVLAKELGLTPGTVTQIAKKMAKMGLVTYEPYAGVNLTHKGRRHARKVVRSHRVFERFLHESLGLNKMRAHTEACRLEHAVGEDTVEKMHLYMGYPKESIDEREIPGSKDLVPLSEVRPGQKGKVMCIKHGGACVVSKLLGLGIAPGEDFEFLRKVGWGPVILKVGDSEVAIGRGIARRIMVVLE
jgi:DtxR family Mn-dependent transcriptional regulator